MAWLVFRQVPFCRALATLWAVLAMCALWTGAEAGEAAPFHLNIGFSCRAFVNVPQEDIRIAVRILARKVARNTVGSADSRVYDSITDIEHDLKAKKLDAVALTPEDFLELSNRVPLDPIMVTATTKGHEVELLLLARKDSAIRSFKDLRNRKLAIPAKVNQYGGMYFTWLETLIMHQGFHGGNRFFTAVTETKKPSQALMQVFFRQAEACLATDHVLELSAELNPQIGRELMIVERFPKLSGGVIAVRNDLREDRKQKLRQALLTLHEDQEGRQLFVLFQLKKLLPYRPEYMRATEAFYAEHHRLAQRFRSKR
jgi:ABC-type phosphate/phosphonate transport system substrate-binding protein